MEMIGIIIPPGFGILILSEIAGTVKETKNRKQKTG
jgi:hypothetical protein